MALGPGTGEVPLSEEDMQFYTQALDEANPSSSSISREQPISEQEMTLINEALDDGQGMVSRKRAQRRGNLPPRPVNLIPEPNLSEENRQALSGEYPPEQEGNQPTETLQAPQLNPPEQPSPFSDAYKNLQETSKQRLAEQDQELTDLGLEEFKAPAKPPATVGRNVVDEARQWVGQQFEPGKVAQCANFVRGVLGGCGYDVGDSKDPIDRDKLSEGEPLGPSYANSFFGTDVGTLITDMSNLLPGDIVGFANTYGNHAEGVITHVGIYAGDGKIIDRPTANEAVKERDAKAIGPIVAGVRPYSYQSDRDTTAENRQVPPHSLRLRTRALAIKEGFNRPQMLDRIFAIESGYNPEIVGENGELGLGQVMEDTLQENLEELGMGHVSTEDFRKDPTMQMNVAATVIKKLGEDPLTNQSWPRVLAAYKGGLDGLQDVLQDPSRLDGDYKEMRDFVSQTLDISPEEAKKFITTDATKNFAGDPYRFEIRPQPERYADAADEEELPDFYLPTNYYAYHLGKQGGSPLEQVLVGSPRAALSATGDFFDMIEARGLGMVYGLQSDEDIARTRQQIARAEKLGIADSEEISNLKFQQKAAEDMKFRVKRGLSALSFGLSQHITDLHVTKREEAKHSFKMSGAQGSVQRNPKGGWSAAVQMGWDEENNQPRVEQKQFKTKQEANAWVDGMSERFPGGNPNTVSKDGRIGRFPKIMGRDGWLESITLDPFSRDTPINALMTKAFGDFLPEEWEGAPTIRMPDIGGGDIYSPDQWPKVLGNTSWKLFNNADAIVAYVSGLKLAGAALRSFGSKIGVENLVAKWMTDPKFAASPVGKILKDVGFRSELGFAAQAYSETMNHHLADAWMSGRWQKDGFKKVMAEAMAAASTNSIYSMFTGISMMGGSYFGGTLMSRFAQNFVNASREAKMKEARRLAEANSKDWQMLSEAEQKGIVQMHLEYLEGLGKKGVLGLEEVVKESMYDFMRRHEAQKTAAFRKSQAKAHESSALESRQVRDSIDELTAMKEAEVADLQQKVDADSQALQQMVQADPSISSLAELRKRKRVQEGDIQNELDGAIQKKRQMEAEGMDTREISREVSSLQSRADKIIKEHDQAIEKIAERMPMVEEFIDTERRHWENAGRLEELSSPYSEHSLGLAALSKLRDFTTGFEQMQHNLSKFYKEKNSSGLTYDEKGVPDIRPTHYQIPEELSGKLIDDLTGAMGQDQAKNMMQSYKTMLDSWNEGWEATAPAALQTITAGYMKRFLGDDTLASVESGLARAEEAIKKMDPELQETRMTELQPLRDFITKGPEGIDLNLAMDNLVRTMGDVASSVRLDGITPPMSISEARSAAQEAFYDLYTSMGDSAAARVSEFNLTREDALIGTARRAPLPEETFLQTEFIGQKRMQEAFLNEVQNHTGNMTPEKVHGLSGNLLRTFNSRNENTRQVTGYSRQLAENRLKEAFKGQEGAPTGSSVTQWQWRTHPVLRELSDALDIDNLGNIGKFMQRNPEFAPLLETFVRYRNWSNAAGVSSVGNNLMRHNMIPKMFPRLKEYLEKTGQNSAPGAVRMFPGGERKAAATNLIQRVSERKKRLTFDQAEEIGRNAIETINTYRGNVRRFKEEKWRDFVFADDAQRANILKMDNTPGTKAIADEIAEDLLLGSVERNAAKMVSDYVGSSLQADNQLMAVKTLTSITDVNSAVPMATFDNVGAQATGKVGKESQPYVRLRSQGLEGWQIVDPKSGKLRDAGDLYVHPGAWDFLQKHMTSFEQNAFDKISAKFRNTLLSGTPFPFLAQQFGQVYKSTNLNLVKSLGVFEIGAQTRKNHADLVSQMQRNGLQRQDYLSNVTAFTNSPIGQTLKRETEALMHHAEEGIDTPGLNGRSVKDSMKDFINHAREWNSDSPWYKRAARGVGETLKQPLDQLLRADQWMNENTTFSAIRDAQVGATVFHTNRMWEKYGPKLLAQGKSFDEAYNEVQKTAVDYVNQISGSLPSWWVSSNARKNLFRYTLTPQWTGARITAWGGWLDEELFGGKMMGRFNHLSPEMRDAMKREYRWLAINGTVGALTWANALSYMINGSSTANNPNGKVFDVMVGDYLMPNPMFGHDRQILDIFAAPFISKAAGDRPGRTAGHMSRSLRRVFALTSPMVSGLAEVGTGALGRQLQPDREVESALELGAEGFLNNVGMFSDSAQNDPMTGAYRSPEVRASSMLGSFPAQIRPEQMLEYARHSETMARNRMRKKVSVAMNRAVSHLGRNPEMVEKYFNEVYNIIQEGEPISKEALDVITSGDKDKAEIYKDGKIRISNKQLETIIMQSVDPERAAYKRLPKALRDEFVKYVVEQEKRKKKSPSLQREFRR